jgi:hypothetical protein
MGLKRLCVLDKSVVPGLQAHATDYGQIFKSLEILCNYGYHRRKDFFSLPRNGTK